MDAYFLIFCSQLVTIMMKGVHKSTLGIEAIQIQMTSMNTVSLFYLFIGLFLDLLDSPNYLIDSNTAPGDWQFTFWLETYSF